MSSTLYMWRVVDFVYVESRRLCICGESSTLYMWRVVGFVYVESHRLLYAGSHRHFCNLTDMRRKPSACFGLRVGMVPKSYQ
jgi:hypothetical protein